MSPVILTFYFENYQPLADIVLPNLDAYCKKQGYILEYGIGDSGGLPYGFQKWQLLQQVLQRKDVDLVLCIDLDVLITNFSKRLEEFVDDQHDLFVTEDTNGLNAGSFIIRNGNWAIGFVEKILSHAGQAKNEQGVMKRYINDAAVKVLPHPSINSYMCDAYGPPRWGKVGGPREKQTHEEGDWRRGDFLLHLPGMKLARRIAIMTEKLKEIVYD